MIELGAVTRALLAIARDLRDDRVLAEQICRACVAGLDVDGAAISLLTASTLRETLWASDATAELLEDLQFSLGEGPCIEAATAGRPVLVTDLSDIAQTSRWPIYAAAVVEQAGVGAVFALPLQWGAITVGVLDLYRRAPGWLSPEQSRDALSAADAAALMLLGLRTDPGDDLAWDRSWSNRAEIHQATGMVVVQLGISAADAFARLRAHAFAEQRLLGDVARDVVARRLHFSKET
jgi:transcriptional regulator with GAF, ATPase, and Fis domain